MAKRIGEGNKRGDKLGKNNRWGGCGRAGRKKRMKQRECDWWYRRRMKRWVIKNTEITKLKTNIKNQQDHIKTNPNTNADMFLFSPLNMYFN